MKTLLEQNVFPIRRIIPPKCVSPEIEVEMTKPSTTVTPFPWTSVADGSLRNFGAEYRPATLFSLNTMDKALSDLYAKLEKDEVDWSSPRCSTHVHVNITDIPYPVVLCNILSAYLVDHILSYLWRADRRGNLHCLRLIDDPDQATSLLHLMNTRHLVDQYYNIDGHFSKYRTINIRTLLTYGTVEFRGHHLTQNKESLLKWINICHDLVTKQTYTDPFTLIDDYCNSPREFLYKVLPEHADYIFTRVDEHRELIFNIADDLVFLVANPFLSEKSWKALVFENENWTPPNENDAEHHLLDELEELDLDEIVDE